MIMESKRVRRSIGKLQIKQGHIVAVEFSSIGGVTYQREGIREDKIGERGVESEFVTTKRVDNADLYRESKAIIGAAYYVMDRTCVNTPLGYFADRAQLDDINKQLVDVQVAAMHFNQMAEMLNSARRVVIDIFPLELDVHNRHVVKRLFKCVHDRLVTMYDTLTLGDKKAFEYAFERARNLDSLSVGLQADAVNRAMRTAKAAKIQLLEDIQSGEEPARAGKNLDLKDLLVAIQLFSGYDEVVEELIEHRNAG